VARDPIVTRADVEARYSGEEVDVLFTPTHRVRVVDPRNKNRVLQKDFVRLGEPSPKNGVAYAYGPNPDEALYAALSTGLWQSLNVHGRVKWTPIRYRESYEPSKSRIGFVYFVQAGEDGPIKIGWTQDIDRRIPELQTANARKLRLLGMVPGTLDTEAAFHARFSHLRLEAEWFRSSAEIFDFLQETAVVPL